jgi:hypothetical protein
MCEPGRAHMNIEILNWQGGHSVACHSYECKTWRARSDAPYLSARGDHRRTGQALAPPDWFLIYASRDFNRRGAEAQRDSDFWLLASEFCFPTWRLGVLAVGFSAGCLSRQHPTRGDFLVERRRHNVSQ